MSDRKLTKKEYSEVQAEAETYWKRIQPELQGMACKADFILGCEMVLCDIKLACNEGNWVECEVNYDN